MLQSTSADPLQIFVELRVLEIDFRQPHGTAGRILRLHCTLTVQDLCDFIQGPLISEMETSVCESEREFVERRIEGRFCSGLSGMQGRGKEITDR